MKAIVIGGGPAGMMSAISAAEAGDNVIILEKMESLGKKLLITGKGRCNITNAAEMEEFFRNIPENSKFLYSAFSKYTNRDIVNFTISRHILLYVAFFPRDGLTAFPLAAHEVCKEWDSEVNESI